MREDDKHKNKTIQARQERIAEEGKEAGAGKTGRRGKRANKGRRRKKPKGKFHPTEYSQHPKKPSGHHRSCWKWECRRNCTK
jgi:hypothetical protein